MIRDRKPKETNMGSNGTFSIRYVVNGVTRACDWQWPRSETALWSISEREGVAWDPIGKLDEKGREVLLDKFGLTAAAEELPLDVIGAMSPAALEKRRRRLETERGLPRIEVMSDTMGSHFSASLAA